MKRVFTIICLLVTMLPAKADCWYNSSWSHRIKIRIVAAQVNGVHTDFPVYFDLNDLSATNFFAEVRADGGDIRITQSDGQTELAREIVAINTGGSTGEMHFKVPDLSGGEVFYIYYGNAAATEPAAGSAFGSENVWTNNFLSVYHLEEDPSGGAPQILDSTSAGIDGTSAGGMATGDSVAGQIENALDFDGINDTIGFPTTSVSSLGGTAAATVSAWANSNNANWNNFGGIATSDNVFALYPINGSRQVGFYFNTGGWVGSFITPANIQVWHKYEVTYDGTTNRSYLDGGATTATAADTGNITGAPTFFDTGGSPTWGLFTDLRVDELRVASVVRSDDWITTSYNNQNSPGAFWTVSSEDEEATEWYGCDWKYREVIRVVPAQVNGTQTDFPLYFDLGDLPADFFTEVRTDGGDIRVTECDGITELAREVVFLDNGASTGEIHFKAPSISGGEEYFIYYGNPSGTDYAVTDTFGAQNVWTNNYLAVWHLDEDPAGGASSITDSSSSGYHGTPQNGLSTADLTAGAQVGKAMNFDGNNERIDIPSGLSTNISGIAFHLVLGIEEIILVQTIGFGVTRLLDLRVNIYT